MGIRDIFRPHFFESRAVLLLAACAAACATAIVQVADAQPNVIVIISDDAGYNDFGFMSEVNGIPTDVRTPNIDALAAQGTILSMGYTSGAVCSPARAALLTGQYQQRFGHEDNPNQIIEGLAPGQQLITHHLKDLGYTTGMVGKWHLGYEPGISRPLDVGFDEFYGLYGGGRPYWGLGSTDAGRTLRRGNENIERQWVNEGDVSRYDPVRGRYLTDAFGEEAVDFINRHAADENPFFLYAALPAPHTPLQAKQSDLDEFANIPDINRRAIAAMTYAMDRAVGDMMSALATHGIDDNTIVVFIGDNGGPAPSVAPYNNGPLRGAKGSVFEGGIRVPFLIKGPGMTPGVYDRPTSALDILPTLVNAAAGDASLIDTNGVDLMPYLSGEAGGDPHEYLFWRGPNGRFAVRKGDWKLVLPPNNNFLRLYNTALNLDETIYYNAEHPELITELLHELTVWESGLAKPKWGALGSRRNRFDHFVYREDAATAAVWSASNGWKQAGTDTPVTFISEDAYANAVLEFKVRNDSDYTSTNDLLRMTRRTFMLNQLRFTGDYGGAINHSGTINGNALLFVNNLDGGAPQIRLEATGTSAASRFSFQLDNEIQLYNDLEISGDGTQDFVIRGNVRDYREPRAVIKSGSSSVTLAGSNTFAGPLVIQQGRVSAAHLAGSVQNLGGTFSPSATPGAATVNGDFVQHGGTLEFDLGGTTRGLQYDALLVGGNLSAGGVLKVSFVDGYTPSSAALFDLFDWSGTLNGVFDDIQLPALAEGFSWSTSELYESGKLRLIGPPEPGDLNADYAIDAADYVVWRKLYDTVPAHPNHDDWSSKFGHVEETQFQNGDLNADRAIDAADYVLLRKGLASISVPIPFEEWLANFAQTDESGELAIDANSDGIVDAADYVAWRKGLVRTSVEVSRETWSENFSEPGFDVVDEDFNSDGNVDAADYVVWRKTWEASPEQTAHRDWWRKFGFSADGASSFSTAVPEPSAAAMALVAICAIMIPIRCATRSSRASRNTVH
jgi:autotransporter-associated beta strand protein